ncbi:GroES-like protein [Mollisia scopiformis]|uniref:GroES-like protein n=1 Tax=Mollisia scopiformis TaxID=149040 RepID=A0A194XIT8_MOLSC|nr:GroES-like protein [Mollisia scopiformis]KUJ20150.1 GroES-like protein [Mollisia scopiformis]
MASSRDNLAAWIVEAKGRIEVRPSEFFMPEKGEVLIRVQASGLQPADAKVAKLGIMNLKYPTILGSPVAGFVEAVGEDVDKVKVGERVVSGTMIFTSGGVAKFGASQRFVIVDAREVVPIGNTAFPTAIATASQTPLAALYAPGALNMSRPNPSPNPAPANGKKILIWGGSSAMGALSICYAKLAGYTVISTSSPHNFPLLKDLGADYIFDRSDNSTVSKIKELFPIDYWFDTISLSSSLTPIRDILDGVKEQVEIITLLPPSMSGGEVVFPENVKTKMLLFRNKAEENQDLVQWMLGKGGYLEQGLTEGWIKGVPAETIGGLGAVAEGIERLHKGVSARKIVIEPWIEQ